MNPFKLQHDPIEDEWYIILEHPKNDQNFVVPFRSKNYEDCEPVCESLNNLIEAHWDLRAKQIRQDITDELGEVEP